MNGAAQLIAVITSPVITYFSFRTIINGGFVVLSICMAVIGILAIEEMNTLLVVVMMIYLAVYQWTLGTYCWVYLGAVACEEGLSLGTATIWAGVLILTISTNTMFNVLGSAGVFFFFSAGSAASAVFFFFFLKETKGISRE